MRLHRKLYHVLKWRQQRAQCQKPLPAQHLLPPKPRRLQRPHRQKKGFLAGSKICLQRLTSPQPQRRRPKSSQQLHLALTRAAMFVPIRRAVNVPVASAVAATAAVVVAVVAVKRARSATANVVSRAAMRATLKRGQVKADRKAVAGIAMRTAVQMPGATAFARNARSDLLARYARRRRAQKAVSRANLASPVNRALKVAVAAVSAGSEATGCRAMPQSRILRWQTRQPWRLPWAPMPRNRVRSGLLPSRMPAVKPAPTDANRAVKADASGVTAMGGATTGAMSPLKAKTRR